MRPRMTGSRLRDAWEYSREAFAPEARPNQAYMGGVERGQRNVGVVNLYQIAEALDMSLPELYSRSASVPKAPRPRIALRVQTML